METKKIKADRKSGSWQRGCTLQTIYPGFAIGPDDSGLAAVGKIERSYALPGFVASMHPHRDDEIFSYVQSGTLLHIDSMGHEEKISLSKVRVINAGTAFQHEERVLGGDPVEAFHVVLRPQCAALEPMVQFSEIRAVQGELWRLLAAQSGAPLTLRVKAWLYDAHLDVGTHLFPSHSSDSSARILIVMDGDIRIAGTAFQKGDVVALGETAIAVVAFTHAALLLVAADWLAPSFTGGLSSGNIVSQRSRQPVPFSGTARSGFSG